jgi:transcriptional regulator with XRE-family HTH domain
MGMTNEEFAARVDVTDSYASYLRNGKRLPSGDLLVKIILTFELDPVPAMKAYQEGGNEFGAFLRKHVFSVKPSPAEPVTVVTGTP